VNFKNSLIVAVTGRLMVSMRDTCRNFVAAFSKFTFGDACALLFAYGLPHIEMDHQWDVGPNQRTELNHQDEVILTALALNLRCRPVPLTSQLPGCAFFWKSRSLLSQRDIQFLPAEVSSILDSSEPVD
jgi:hypothetical protein